MSIIDIGGEGKEGGGRLQIALKKRDMGEREAGPGGVWG